MPNTAMQPTAANAITGLAPLLAALWVALLLAGARLAGKPEVARREMLRRVTPIRHAALVDVSRTWGRWRPD